MMMKLERCSVVERMEETEDSEVQTVRPTEWAGAVCWPTWDNVLTRVER